jgi:hypothetical protein
MSPKEQLKKIPIEDSLLAPFLVLVIGKLTGWNEPTGGGGDPVYLTGDETASLAAEGIRLLAQYLPQEPAQQVASAVERLPRPPHGSPEERLLRIGSFGGVLPKGVTQPTDGPPGCCIRINERLVCVR